MPALFAGSKIFVPIETTKYFLELGHDIRQLKILLIQLVIALFAKPK
jgi:hypothetical protein